jgi:hypothetical protein
MSSSIVNPRPRRHSIASISGTSSPLVMVPEQSEMAFHASASPMSIRRQAQTKTASVKSSAASSRPNSNCCESVDESGDAGAEVLAGPHSGEGATGNCNSSGMSLGSLYNSAHGDEGNDEQTFFPNTINETMTIIASNQVDSLGRSSGSSSSSPISNTLPLKEFILFHDPASAKSSM